MTWQITMLAVSSVFRRSGVQRALTCEDLAVDLFSSQASRRHCSRSVSNVSALY